MGTALVTGASVGLGREFARQLAAKGHDVVLVARDAARLQEVADELNSGYGVTAEVLTADLADRRQTQVVADRLTNPQRPVDLLVNNAGFGDPRGFLEAPVEDAERALDVMVRAVLVLSHAAGGAMVQRRRGAILNVSSVASFAAMGTYSAAKSWVTVFSEGLATELAGTGVTVTAVCPGFVRTEFHRRGGMDLSGLPEPLWLEADQVVRVALDAVAAGRVVSVPSVQYRVLVGAMRLLPRAAIRSASATTADRRHAPR